MQVVIDSEICLKKDSWDSVAEIVATIMCDCIVLAVVVTTWLDAI